jgi:hypothetical protein
MRPLFAAAGHRGRPRSICITGLPARAGAATIGARLRIQGIRAQGHGSRAICAVEGRLPAAVLPACGKSRPRAPKMAAGIGRVLEQDDFSSNRHPALSFCLSVIFSENWCPAIQMRGRLFPGHAPGPAQGILRRLMVNVRPPRRPTLANRAIGFLLPYGDHCQAQKFSTT